MTRFKRLLAIIVTAAATLAIGGCHTTVVEHVDKHEPHPDHPDHPDDHRPPPPPPDHPHPR
jgi:hypothetical protein